jgi:hypothetical protein
LRRTRSRSSAFGGGASDRGLGSGGAFAKLKALLKAAARTLDQLHRAVAVGIDAFSLKECANYFTAAGYEPE